jgi:hypothetical protein
VNFTGTGSNLSFISPAVPVGLFFTVLPPY